MNKQKPYNDYGTWLGTIFPFKVQKISVNARLSCPNRDGRIGFGGCIYCNNESFSPAYCAEEKSVARQLNEGKAFFERKYPEMRYLAYFQSFTNTYAPLPVLRQMYEEALMQEGVVGLVIGTRPDCVSDELLDYLACLSRKVFVLLEFGIETANDKTLCWLNRNHTFQQAVDAVERASRRGIHTCGHIILGLPGEGEAEILRQAPIISSLRLDVLKLHQLQIIRGTRLAEIYLEKPFPLFTVDRYIALLGEYIQRIRPTLVLERFTSSSPKHLLIAPDWGIKNYEFANLLMRHLQENGIRQGQKWG